jgi:hypothetical protein
MSGFMDIIEENSSILTFNVVCGIIAAIAVFIMEIVIAYKNAGKKPKNRKVEKAKRLGHAFPTTFMDVYYIHSPRRAFVECEYSYIRGYTAIFVYIIPIAVGIIVAKCMGGI